MGEEVEVGKVGPLGGDSVSKIFGPGEYPRPLAAEEYSPAGLSGDQKNVTENFFIFLNLLASRGSEPLGGYSRTHVWEGGFNCSFTM